MNDTVLKQNPNLYVFLPIFYMVWSDAVLTPSEINTLRSLIDQQTWLKAEEKKFLYDQLNPSSPPSPDEFRHWLEEIKKVLNPASTDQKESLVDIGIRLAEFHSANTTNNGLSHARESLSRMEDTLGLISGEALYHFYPESRKTITQRQSTQQTFNVSALAQLLDGPHSKIIQKVKTLLSDPEFKYIETDNLSDHREKVLKWCRHLADQGYGAMAYPKEYGGSGDMGSYFAIMEALSYHDLSLVIKFGVQFGLFGMSIYFLGTEKHHKKYLKDIGTLDLPGCFAITETGHG